MAESIVVPGDKLHVMTRRLFEQDIRRHFAGVVIAVAEDLCELEGYAFILRPMSNEFRRRPELRHRILSLAQADHIVNKIPREVEIKALEYRLLDRRLCVTDGAGFTLDINEFSSTG